MQEKDPRSPEITEADVSFTPEGLLTDAHDLEESDIVKNFLKQIPFPKEKIAGETLLKTYGELMLREHVKTLPGWENYSGDAMSAASEIRDFLVDIVESAVNAANRMKKFLQAGASTTALDEDRGTFETQLVATSTPIYQNVLPLVLNIKNFQWYVDEHYETAVRDLERGKSVSPESIPHAVCRATRAIYDRLGMAPDFEEAVRYGLKAIKNEGASNAAAIQERFMALLAYYLGVCNAGYAPEIKGHPRNLHLGYNERDIKIELGAQERNVELIRQEEGRAAKALEQLIGQLQ